LLYIVFPPVLASQHWSMTVVPHTERGIHRADDAGDDRNPDECTRKPSCGRRLLPVRNGNHHRMSNAVSINGANCTCPRARAVRTTDHGARREVLTQGLELSAEPSGSYDAGERIKSEVYNCGEKVKPGTSLDELVHGSTTRCLVECLSLATGGVKVKVRPMSRFRGVDTDGFVSYNLIVNQRLTAFSGMS
jgi:hypothetical protein